MKAANPDYTFGTLSNDNGSATANLLGSFAIRTKDAKMLRYNSDVIRALINSPSDSTLGHQLNPRKNSYFTAQSSSLANGEQPGLGSDFVLRDIWGHPYIITLDLNYDDQCIDGYYGNSNIMKSAITNAGTVMVWSMGPDGKVDSSNNSTAQVKNTDDPSYANNDNVLSWQP